MAKEYTYKITGEVFYTDPDNQTEAVITRIEDYIATNGIGAEKAFELFLSENEDFEFFGRLKNCDITTGGGIWAEFYDSNEAMFIHVVQI